MNCIIKFLIVNLIVQCHLPGLEVEGSGSKCMLSRLWKRVKKAFNIGSDSRMQNEEVDFRNNDYTTPQQDQSGLNVPLDLSLVSQGGFLRQFMTMITNKRTQYLTRYPLAEYRIYKDTGTMILVVGQEDSLIHTLSQLQYDHGFGHGGQAAINELQNWMAGVDFLTAGTGLKQFMKKHLQSPLIPRNSELDKKFARVEALVQQVQEYQCVKKSEQLSNQMATSSSSQPTNGRHSRSRTKSSSMPKKAGSSSKSKTRSRTKSQTLRHKSSLDSVLGAGEQHFDSAVSNGEYAVMMLHNIFTNTNLPLASRIAIRELLNHLYTFAAEGPSNAKMDSNMLAAAWVPVIFDEHFEERVRWDAIKRKENPFNLDTLQALVRFMIDNARKIPEVPVLNVY